MQNPLAAAQVLQRGSRRGPRGVWLSRSARDTRLTSRSQCQGSGVTLKSRVLQAGRGSRGGPSVLGVRVCGLLSRQSWPGRAKKAAPWQGLMAGWCSLLWLVHSFQVKLGKWHCVKIPSRMNVLLPQCICPLGECVWRRRGRGGLRDSGTIRRSLPLENFTHQRGADLLRWSLRRVSLFPRLWLF